MDEKEKEAKKATLKRLLAGLGQGVKPVMSITIGVPSKGKEQAEEKE